MIVRSEALALALAALFAAPAVLFDLLFLRAGFGVAAAGALLAGLWLVLRRGRDDSAGPTPAGLAACMALALLACLLGGEGRWFHAVDDWIIRDAVLHDLVLRPWPVRYDEDGTSRLLRAPLALYLGPALIGKLAGLAAAHGALLVQNAAILSLVLASLAGPGAGWRAALTIGPLFLLFSGLDVLPFLARLLAAVAGGATPPWAWHLEAWAGPFQYSAHLSQLFWVPHHALAGWYFAVSYGRWRDGRADAAALALPLGLGLLWSPLVVAGALPIAGFALASDALAGRLRLWALLGPALLTASLVPAALYLVLDSGDVEKRWLLTEPGFLASYVPFLVVEVVPFLLVIAGSGRRAPHGETAVLVLLLLLFPLAKLSFSNDWTMRASIPALAVLAMRVVDRLGEAARRREPQRRTILVVLALGAATPAVEIVRALTWPASPLGRCDLPAAWRDSPFGGFPMATYLAGEPPEGLATRLLRPSESWVPPPCGPVRHGPSALKPAAP